MHSMLSSALFTDVEQYQLPVSFSLVAHFAFAITGALAAVRRGYDLIGVLFLATITAGGGGLIRDGLLISAGPPSILTDANLFYVMLAGAILTLIFHRFVPRLGRAIAIVDALGLGAFAVHGVQRSLEGGLSAPAAILGGTITAVGGGLLRDILVRDEPLLFKPGQFYALVAIGGCCLYLGLLKVGWDTPKHSALVTIAVVFTIRLLAIRFNWKTSAVYIPPQPPLPSS
jgi:uncharacterized membrane protein YeiH